jgi:hypothetical protein
MRTLARHQGRSRRRLAGGAILALAVGCSAQPHKLGPSHPAAQIAVPVALTPNDLAAYRKGVGHQVRLLREQLAQRPRSDRAARRAELEEGAAAAGLSQEEYRVLTATVDSALRSRSSHWPGRVNQAGFTSPTVDSVFDRMADELDSLRVELIVLRLQLAGVGQPRD